MMARRRVTIREVALAAGVSTQTVSRVLNHRPDVAPETVTRVRAVISELGYSPNLLARGLTQGRTNVLGVVAYGLDYFGPSRIITGIEEQAASMGYSISLTLIHRPETDEVDALLTNLVSRQVDGILWAIPEVANNRAWLRSGGSDLPLPLVFVGGIAVEPGYPSIGIDNEAIGRLATEHLLEGGARKVGIITGPRDWWEARQREVGWRRAMDAAGVSTVDLVVEGDWTASSGDDGLDRLLERAPDIDAVFASNDQMALGVIHAAHRAGRRIPEDLAVVGVDDIAEGSHFWPPLTTVHQPLRDAGVLAVETIDRLVREADRAHRGRSPADGYSRFLQPRLIVRQSSRPAPVGGAVAATAQQGKA
jgi:LacI family transcriptional regulator